MVKRDTMLASPPENFCTVSPDVVGAIDETAATCPAGLAARPSIGSLVGAPATAAGVEVCCAIGLPGAPRVRSLTTAPLSSIDRLTLAISLMGRVWVLFQTTICSESFGRMARIASYISRALVTCPVF